jgi:ribonuclease G
VLERALPFRPGEEVYVEIVEPHMYSAGDAVAKVDGYIIEVKGGTPYVGEKHLVRIEDAGRTRAVASLIDLPADERAPADEAADEGDSGDSLSSSRQRRGRRGGRRRSEAATG